MKKENTYIMNLEGAYIYKDILDDKKITSKKRDLSKLFSATMPYSVETIKINKFFPNAFYTVKRKQYTKKIINITFNKNYTVWDEEKGKRKVLANKKKIRKYLYVNGFVLDGIKYVFYKRGSGKAKNGFALFIQEDMKQKLLDESRLGLKFYEDEELDLTSLLAYESLIASSIEFTIELDPKTEILIIDDIYGKEFEVNASVTREIKGELETKNEIIKLKNCLTDGQGLLDESVFKKHKKEEHGFMLLRNDIFKCCAFNTKLQDFFKHRNIEKVKDMYGNTYDSDKIKLITTPNSLKFLKFAYKIKDGDEKDCFKYWQDNISSVLGVVKCDKETNFGNYNRTTYQLLNSIPNLTYDELFELTKVEREYVNLLKNDEVVFRNYISKDYKLGYFLNKGIDETDVSSYETMDLMNCLLLVNSDIQYTRKFKKIKSEIIVNYIKNLKLGKIRLKDTKYVTIFSNPYEMLLASIGEFKNESIMEGREVYCPYYDDKQEFCVSRNPHINAGNVMHTTNRYHKEYNDWFNLTDNICVINFFDNDAPDRLQGCDTDSDTVLLLPHEILVEKSRYCEENFPTPINKVEGRSIPRKYNMTEIYELDIILSNNYIGQIVNLSQILNSYMNDAIYKDEPKEIIDELYQLSSRLSSLSQIEIDKSKKIFDNVNMRNEIKKIKNIEYINYVREEDKFENMANKMIVPKFFSLILNSGDYKIFEKFNTPLDVLQDVLVFSDGNRSRNKDFKDLLIQTNEAGNVNYRQIKIIYDTVSKCGKVINGLKIDTCKLNSEAKKTIRRREKEKAIEKLRKYKINTATVLNVFKRCFKLINDDFGFSRYSLLSLNLLFLSNKLQVLECFRGKDISYDEILIELEKDGEYCIFGNYFNKMFIKDIKM